MSALPNFVIIGAMKCGTTSLHYYLSRHPEIMMPKIKELRFFVTSFNWERGVDWYCSHFDAAAPLRGEASPAYTMHPRLSGVPQRMQRLIPAAKLIYIVRDPIERLVSEYLHRLRNGSLCDPLPTLLDRPEGRSMLRNSCYYDQISQYLPFYPARQICIVTSEGLLRQRQATLAEIFRFLAVDERFSSSSFRRVKHVTRNKRRLNAVGSRIVRSSERHLNRRYPGVQRALVNVLCLPFSQPLPRCPLDAQTRHMLAETFAPDVAALRRFSGLALSEWSV